MLTVVITHKNDPLLAWTIENVWRTQDVSTQIIVVDDATNPNDMDVPAEIAKIAHKRPAGSSLRITSTGTLGQRSRAVGVCPSRHLGICEAAYDAVLVIDSHVDFKSNDWASSMVCHIAKNKTDVCSTRCWRLAPDRLSFDDASGYEAGAWINPMQTHESGRRMLFQARWSGKHRDAQEAVEVGCILGGAYLLWRPHYFDIGSPWQHMRGWGVAEPVLSLTNAALGHRSVCLPIDVGHVFRTGEQQRALFAFDMGEIEANQLYALEIAAAVVGREAEWYEYRKWFFACDMRTSDKTIIRHWADYESRANGFFAFLQSRAIVDPFTHIEKWSERA